MEVILINSEAYYKLQEEMKSMVKIAFKEALENALEISDPANEWINFNEAKKILHVKSKTSWQRLRDSGIVVFSQYGRKILYNKKSLMDHVQKHKVKF